ncbi:homeobox protein dve-1 [Cylas formicarius]|uniref:homeobox protein dve-1 n=1 Tax=Cylas formicarius TaxID=197179 RepID=UPI0029585B05|nr:homeobox protein dve-1 [Cylas formicarius]
MTMDFQSAMETFAEAWVAASIKGAPLSEVGGTQSQALALTRNNKTPPPSAGRTSRDSAERTSTPQPTSTPLENTISPHSIKEESSIGKSIPVHCIVEAISTLEENRYQHGVWRRRPMVETDTYVIIPTGTPFQNLVQAALYRLGYSSESAAAAKGSVIIKNWKALTFEQISDDPLVTVGDILGELTTIATLRIQVFRGRPGSWADIKDKLLRYLLLQSHSVLISSGCPLDEIVLAQICRSNSTSTGVCPELSEDTRRKFDMWWATQFNSQSSASRSQFIPSYTNQYSVPPQPTPPLERPLTETTHPAMQNVHSQFPTQKTRMRTSFDPELELPKLQRWFTENQHPSRQQIQQYVKELNGLESRRGRKPLDINNVVYWFKNARAAQKRAEVRNVTPNLHLSVNGYNNHSPTNGGFLMAENYLNSDRLKNNVQRRAPQNSHTSDEFSNPGSDMEDEDLNEVVHSPSPSVPLSLTTPRKSNSREPSPKNEISYSPARDIQTEKCKEEQQQQRANYTDKALSNEEDDRETEDESKSRNESNVSPSRSITQRFCNSPDINARQLIPRNHEGLDRLTSGFPLVPNTMFSHNIMYMSQYIPGLSHSAPSSALSMSSLTVDERRKRNRTFIDPVTEVPRLEQWFAINTHPSHNLIIKYTEELNCMAYRQKFPRLEPKNVQFWFKNRRAKCKRLKMSLYDVHSGQFHHERE